MPSSCGQVRLTLGMHRKLLLGTFQLSPLGWACTEHTVPPLLRILHKSDYFSWKELQAMTANCSCSLSSQAQAVRGSWGGLGCFFQGKLLEGALCEEVQSTSLAGTSLCCRRSRRSLLRAQKHPWWCCGHSSVGVMLGLNGLTGLFLLVVPSNPAHSVVL